MWIELSVGGLWLGGYMNGCFGSCGGCKVDVWIDV